MKKAQTKAQHRRVSKAGKTPPKLTKKPDSMPPHAKITVGSVAKPAPVAKATARAKAERRLRVMVSSSVFGHENLLDGIYGLLDSYGYEVWMSVAGTLRVNPRVSAMTSCLEAVEKCDLFLGMILPRYGSGRESSKARSITHREQLLAIQLNKPRWFLVHEHVAVARQLLEPFRDEKKKPAFVFKEGIPFIKTAVIDDPRVFEMYESAMRHDISEVADRTGNWVQPFANRKDALLFASTQFRRYREVMDELSKKLANEPIIRAQVKGGGK